VVEDLPTKQSPKFKLQDCQKREREGRREGGEKERESQRERENFQVICTWPERRKGKKFSDDTSS
jgi:hypothetical protein